MARVVIAPDSFKGTIAAADAARALAEGWREARPGDDVVELPQADGGESTLAAIAAAVPGAGRREARVTGPDGRPVTAAWLLLPDRTGVVELAESSGLPLMAAPDPMGATTYGLGEVLGAALDAGAERLVIGVGGSASTDGGAGALQALGLQLRDAAGGALGLGGGALADLAVIDGAGLRPPPAGGVRVLVDVTAPLLGPQGAAAVFGPQKGADARQVAALDAALARWAAVLGGDVEARGAGAAGGTSFGLASAWGAELVPGAAEVARLSGLVAALTTADVLVTGEGRFDATSLQGKATGHALALAGPRLRRLVVAGRVDVVPARGIRAVALADLAGDARASMAEPERWLRRAARGLADEVL